MNKYRKVRGGRLKNWLSGLLAVSTAVIMLSGQIVSFYGDEPEGEYALAGARSGEDITIHFGEDENKSINVHVNPESDAGLEALGDETESETEAKNTGLEKVDAGGFVTISPADESLLPEEAEASAEILTGKAENTAVEKVEEAVSTETTSETGAPVGNSAQDGEKEAPAGVKSAPEEGATLEADGKTEYRVFEISLENVDEEQYQEGFKVEVFLPEDVRGRNFRLFHIHEGQEPVEIPIETVGTVDHKTGLEVVSGFEFQTDGFSEFVLQYTVDFHWTVDGKSYEFSIPGGGFVSFRKLVELLGIAYDTDNWNAKGEDEKTEEEKEQPETVLTLDDVEVSETTRKFVLDVENVDFSNPELVWVGKVKNENTVGGIKEEKNLEVQYSAELTEEQIAEINAQTVEAGDWALISMQPFTSEETLTVTMKDGSIFTIKVTDALHVDVDDLVGKEIVIYDKTENRALTSLWESNDYRTQFNSIEYSGKGTVTPDNAHWIVEKYDNNYYLKSHDGKYLKIDQNNVYLVNNGYEGTALTIQKGGNPDYRIYAAGDDSKILTYSENNQYEGLFAAPGGTRGTGNTRQWLGIDYAVSASDRAGDWLLYFDDDYDEITIHVGETITLRPYSKWEWKEGDTDVQTAHWNIGGKDNSFWNQINRNDRNGAHMTVWGDSGTGNNTAGFQWTAYVKEDTQLKTHYWSVQGLATKTGVYYLTNTKNNKTIKVNVVDGEPVNKPGTVSGAVDILVNLFDYDRYYKLDPTDNSNLANNNNNKTDSVNGMGRGNLFYFLSSGSGNKSSENWNSYTNAQANRGILKSQLGSDGYPELNHGSTNTSLQYLFDTTQTIWTGGHGDGMIAYPNVSGMFQKDSDGYYYFNSNTNYFYYNGSSHLYEHTYTQTSGEDKASLVNDKPIGFFPFHDYDSTSNLYVNQNHNLNHHVGMSMEIPFQMNPDKRDENGKPIKFEFTGDDDLWVFAEWTDEQGNKQSKLILDVGGIHQPVYGYIDFTVDRSSSLNSMGLQSGVEYKLKVYYLERGGCDSNLAVRFNIPVINLGDVAFTKKETNTGHPLPGAVFGLYRKQSCSDDSIVRQATSDENGHVLFNDLSIGTYYMKEITPPDGYSLSTADYKVQVNAKNKSEITLINGASAPGDYSYRIDNTPITTQATVRKIWTGNGTPPDSLTVILTENGEATEQTRTLNSQNGWTATITDLPKYKNGKEIDYGWTESNLPAGYFLTGYTMEEEAEETITTITNTYQTYNLKTKYVGIKNWSDQNNKYSTRPDKLNVTLYASYYDASSNSYGDPDPLDNVCSWQKDTATNQWTYTFEDLPVFDENGNVIKYSAQEKDPAGYSGTPSNTQTEYAIGTINWSEVYQKITEGDKLTWNLGSLIDLPFLAVKTTGNNPTIVWTSRVPTPYEEEQIRSGLIAGNKLPGCNQTFTWCSGSAGTIDTGHGSVTVTFDEAKWQVDLQFGSHSSWSQFVYGQFNGNNSSRYNIGTTDFSNTLQTTSLSGTKTWDIGTDTLPADPILVLTRTVTTTQTENGEMVELTSEPEIVTVKETHDNQETVSNLQPEWSATVEGKRTFIYRDLPKYDPDGNEYAYSVAESSFTIEIGEDAVTYTAVKQADGSYTVIADKGDAPAIKVTQSGNDIRNETVKASIEVIKVEKGHKDSEHTLSGAKFQLTRVNIEDDKEYSGPGEYKSEIQAVDDAGNTKFINLRPGRYKLKEVEAPAGFVLVEGPWFITIDQSGTARLTAEYSLASQAESPNSFFIENVPGAALPASGGPGTRLFTILGGILALGAGVLLWRRRRST